MQKTWWEVRSQEVQDGEAYAADALRDAAPSARSGVKDHRSSGGSFGGGLGFSPDRARVKREGRPLGAEKGRKSPFLSLFLWPASLWGILLFVGIGSVVSACGEPSVCQNDTQCSAGRICLRGVCADASALDASVEPRQEQAPEASPEAPKEVAAEASPDRLPEASPEDNPDRLPEGTEVGLREQGQSCDPRALAWPWDRCKPGLGCAEIGQTSPSSGSPQPYGICFPACSAAKPSCPAGSSCIETKDTKTRQPTGIFVCTPESEAGGFCTNDASCKQGLVCKIYGTTGSNWFCQASCETQACAASQACEAMSSSQPDKVCKPKATIGEICNALITCEDGAGCAPSGLLNTQDRCLKRCDTAPQACDPQTEVCSRVVVGSVSGSFCFKRSKRGDPCYGDRACADPGDICVRDEDTLAYASCLKVCQAANDCQAGEACERFSQEVITKACVKTLAGGSIVDTLTTCSASSRALAIAAGDLSFCAPDCSLGTGTAPVKCGVLTPAPILELAATQRGLWAVGGEGFVGCSADQGSTWQRLQTPVDRSFRSIAVDARSTLMLLLDSQGELWVQASAQGFECQWQAGLRKVKVSKDSRSVALKQDGSAAILVGLKGWIAQSTDQGQTWKTIPPPTGFQEDLTHVAYGLPSDGGVWLAVGAQGSILRSTDDGATWALIPSGTTQALYRASLVTKNAAFQALIVGDQGVLLSSTDKGLTWKAEASGVTAPLRGILSETATPIVVGDAGIIVRFEQGLWTTITPPVIRDLHAAAFGISNLLLAGSLGSVFLSSDQGKTWAAVSKALLTCLRVSTSSGNAGGACAFLCDPAKQGADCPLEMNRCAALSGSTTTICQPGSIDIPGTAGQGQACIRNPRTPEDQRCSDGFLCLPGKQPSCVKRCKADGSVPCASGEDCLFRPELSNYFCGRSEAIGRSCDVSQGLFCQAGTRCTTTPGTQEARCTSLPQGDELATCLPSALLPCKPGLICIGLGSTPYRNFCARSCNPTAPAGNQGCDAGWDCLGTTGGGGICAERCSGSSYSCKAKHLICQQVTSSSNKHCI